MCVVAGTPGPGEYMVEASTLDRRGVVIPVSPRKADAVDGGPGPGSYTPIYAAASTGLPSSPARP